MKIIGNSHVPGLITWISNRLSSSASQLYAPRFGISLTDWRVLAFFELHPWNTAAQACASMGFDKAAVSRSIGLLQKRGDVKSRPCGLRKVEYSTTATGKTLYKRMLEVALAREEALLTGLSSAERETLVRLLQQLLENVSVVQQVGEAQTRPKRRPKLAERLDETP
jgi:DNA-binding MarR family transcriptional regulator